MENKAHEQLSANKSRKFGKREDRKKPQNGQNRQNGQKPAKDGKKFDKRKGQNQKKKPKFFWSDRKYDEIVAAYEAQFPDMRQNRILEKHQVNEIARSKRVKYDVVSENEITFEFNGQKQPNVKLVFDNTTKALIWSARRLRFLQKIDAEHKIRALDNAWRMLESFYNKVEKTQNALNETENTESAEAAETAE